MTPAAIQADTLVPASEVVKPTGYRILVRIPLVPERTESGIILPAAARKAEEVASCMAVVLALGETAYQDEDKFPGGRAWCEVGDTVVIRQYSGTRFNIDGQEHRLINDDTVEAVVYDRRRVERV